MPNLISSDLGDYGDALEKSQDGINIPFDSFPKMEEQGFVLVWLLLFFKV